MAASDTSPCDLVIFEDAGFENLLPLVYWRAVFQLRCGTLTLRQRICRTQPHRQVALYVRDYLAAVTTQSNHGAVVDNLTDPQRTLFVNARCLLFAPIPPAQTDLVGVAGDDIAYVWAGPQLAGRLTAGVFADPDKFDAELADLPRQNTDIKMIAFPWDLVEHNGPAICADWRHIDRPRIEGAVHPGAHLLAPDNISIAPGSVVKPGVVLDAENGPIIIAADVTIRPNCTLEGPLFLGAGTLIQPGASIGPQVSIGPVCKVGGELENSIIHSHSNKQHDGFLGHSYIGQWVNLAADTVNSDLKNTYGSVRVPINGRDVDSGRIFVGLTAGDHSKTSISTVFPTGAVVGFACSLFSSQFTPRFVPSFTWLTDSGPEPAVPAKVLQIAQRVMARRNVQMTSAMAELFNKIPELARHHETHTQAP